MRALRGWLIVAVIAASVAGLSSFGLNAYLQQILFYIAINVMLASSLNLVTGFCGQFSLGHAGFMAVGAYTSALVSLNLRPFGEALDFLNFPLYALLAGLAASVAGFVVGMPSLRLRGDYLAIVTLGFGEIIRVVLLNLEVVGGRAGTLRNPRQYGFRGVRSRIFVGGSDGAPHLASGAQFLRPRLLKRSRRRDCRRLHGDQHHTGKGNGLRDLKFFCRRSGVHLCPTRPTP